MTEWISADSGEYPVGRREFQDDFQAGELRSGSSSERRPDAISRDFLTAFCIGPIGFSDTSQGAVARAWRVRVDGRDVYIAGAGESGWVDEVLWLTVPDGPDLIEVDIAFTQSADPVVCFERADGNIWIYWFDPTIPGLDLVLLGSGRNPKVVLDDPFDVTNSDVQLFYISDAQDSICYRTQRERYATEHLTPVTNVADLYLEDAIRDSRYRMHLIASERDRESGRYPKGFFNILSTELFPIGMQSAIGTAPLIFDALVEEAIKLVEVEPDYIEPMPILHQAAVISTIIDREWEDQVGPVPILLSAEVFDVVIRRPMGDIVAPTSVVLDAFAEVQITIQSTFQDEMGPIPILQSALVEAV